MKLKKKTVLSAVTASVAWLVRLRGVRSECVMNDERCELTTSTVVSYKY